MSANATAGHFQEEIRKIASRYIANRRAALARLRYSHWGLFVLSVYLKLSAIPYLSTLLDGFLCRSDVTVLWLRRFNTRRRNERHLLRLIATACTGMAAVVTLQDSQVRRWQGELSTLIVIWVVAFLALASYIYPLFIPIALLITALLVMLLRRLGYKEVTVSTNIKRANFPGITKPTGTWLRKTWATNRVFIVKSADQVWNELIEKMISNVDVVICDVTNISTNVVWELNAVLKRFRPEAVLLACALDWREVRELPRDIRSDLDRLVGADTLKRMRCFFYPPDPPVGFIWPSSFEHELTEYLSTMMAVSIACAPTRFGWSWEEGVAEVRKLDLLLRRLCPYCFNELPTSKNFCPKCDLEVSPLNEPPF